MLFLPHSAKFLFFLMLGHLVLIMFVIVMTCKAFAPEEITRTNLTFNLAIMTLLIIVTNMTKGTFPAGFFRLTDETQI